MQYLMFYRLVHFLREARLTLRKLSPLLNRNHPDHPAPPRMTEQECRQFVRDWSDGKIFSDRHLARHEDIHLVFMPLAFGAAADMAPWELHKLSGVWEYLDKAGPTGINGNPCFFSMRYLRVEDADLVFPAIKRELERREHIQL